MNGEIVATCIGTHKEWTMHVSLHMASTHSFATPNDALAMDALVHVAPMTNIFIGCTNATGVQVRCFLKHDYFGKYFEKMIILEF